MRGGDREETVRDRWATAVPPGRHPAGDLPEKLLDLVDQAVVVCGPSGAVAGFNRPAARLFPELRVGEPMRTPNAGPLALAAAQGVQRFDTVHRGRRLHGHRQGLDGRTVWLVREVPAEREGSAFLERTGRQVAASLHRGRTVRTLARLVVPVLADVALVVLPVHGRRTRWYRAGPGGTEDSGQVSARTLEQVPQVADALSGLQPRAAVVPGDRLTALGVVPEWEHPAGQALVLQLSGSGVVAGALVLLRAPGRPPVGDAEVDLATRFAARAGQALATADQYSQQAHATAVVQAELAPEPLPAVEGVALGAAYRPAAESLSISGDFYHVVPRPGGGVAYFFGDVCGKGIEAAVLAGLVKQSLRTLALAESEPLSQLRLLNLSLLDGESRFTTLVTGFAHPVPGGGLTVVAAGGGHLPPLVLREDGRVEQVDTDGMLVGVVPDARFQRRVVRLGPGELMLFYSDGVTEADGGPTGHELYGDERLALDLATCRGMPAGAVAERVEILTTQWLAGRPHDDIAVLALQAPSLPRRAEGGP